MIDKIFPLAVSKGWDPQSTFDPHVLPQQAEADYVVICQIQRWLMQQHSIYIAVMPWQQNDFSYFVMRRVTTGKRWENNKLTFGGYDNYDLCFAAAIEAALKLLPDDNKEPATNN